MNRLEKLKHCTIDKLEKYNHAAEVYHPASYYAGADKGWELASAEYEKIIAELELTLITATTQGFAHFEDCISLTESECDPECCDCGAYKTENKVLIALQKLKEFRV